MSHIFGGGGGGSTQTIYVPYTPPQPAAAAPTPPPNPPMLGSSQKPIQGVQSPQAQFTGSVIGTVPTGQPTRTLLGTATA